MECEFKLSNIAKKETFLTTHVKKEPTTQTKPKDELRKYFIKDHHGCVSFTENFEKLS